MCPSRRGSRGWGVRRMAAAGSRSRAGPGAHGAESVGHTATHTCILPDGSILPHNDCTKRNGNAFKVGKRGVIARSEPTAPPAVHPTGPSTPTHAHARSRPPPTCTWAPVGGLPAPAIHATLLPGACAPLLARCLTAAAPAPAFLKAVWVGRAGVVLHGRVPLDACTACWVPATRQPANPTYDKSKWRNIWVRDVFCYRIPAPCIWVPGPNRNTSRIQHKAVCTTFYLWLRWPTYVSVQFLALAMMPMPPYLE